MDKKGVFCPADKIKIEKTELFGHFCPKKFRFRPCVYSLIKVLSGLKKCKAVLSIVALHTVQSATSLLTQTWGRVLVSKPPSKLADSRHKLFPLFQIENILRSILSMQSMCPRTSSAYTFPLHTAHRITTKSQKVTVMVLPRTGIGKRWKSGAKPSNKSIRVLNPEDLIRIAAITEL